MLREIAEINECLSADVRALLVAAFAGGEREAQALAMLAPRELIGRIVVAAYNSNIPTMAYRVMIHDAWSMNDGHIVAACKGDRTLVRKLIQRAECDKDNLPETFSIWRGIKRFDGTVGNGLA
jgi:hypothetical protein